MPTALSQPDAAYRPTDGHWDELLEAPGVWRPHWRPVMDALARTGPAELARRWEEGQRLIRDNGVTYNVYDEQGSTSRPWPLDPIPHVIAAGEWPHLEQAIIQRARLANALLADIYGPQRLLREGALPPELIFANPAFLRPCCGIEPPSRRRLQIYAADLARSPDGQWWTLSERTQAPSGAGYALENRLVLRRTLPEVFEAAGVRRLATYFQAYREALAAAAPGNRENPRIVLLTPGPQGETYFEHAYLARYLGFPLVEGADLTVRDQRVYLKTLGGLLPVDVILRRVDDDYCDPVELRVDSAVGVPGLVQALRAGQVTMANALGSGIVESPAFLAFLPGLCRRLLGEELRIPPVATWWCGQERELRYVTENLSRLVIKSAFPGWPRETIFGEELSASGRDALVARLRAHPHQFVAQERVALSTTPVWTPGGLAPRHVVVRLYATGTGDTYTVMPGGLTRVSPTTEVLSVSMQRGGGSKDTWVAGGEASPGVTLLSGPRHPIDVNRATFELPSRVADNLYWLGRYVERVEWSVRTLRSVLPLFSEEARQGRPGLRTAVELLVALEVLPASAANAEEANFPAGVRRELTSLVFESDARGGFRWGVKQVRQLAWLLRDRISQDSWAALTRLESEIASPEPSEALRLTGALDLLDRAVLWLSAFSGLAMENMTRGPGWRLLDIGRRIERAQQVASLVRHGLGHVDDDESGRLAMMLEIADCWITYRSRYLTSLQADLVIDLLLMDEANPRSAAFQLERLEHHVEALPPSQTSVRRGPESRLALGALTALRLADLQELSAADERGLRRALVELSRELGRDLRKLSEALTNSYLTHAVPPRQLARL